MTTVVAIHQPNFFPWLGYFDKIAHSDIFVFLDHVQYQKTGGTWSNRVQLLVGGAARWVTAPLDRSFHGVRPVNELGFLVGNPWRQKFVKTLATNYARAPFFAEVFGFLDPLVMNPETNLARYNSAAIVAICEKFNLPTKKFRWSSRTRYEGQSNQMLTSLTHAVGGTTYLCGGGASEYQDEQHFSDAKVTLKYQNFAHPEYQQFVGQPFVPGLSVIDALMFCGFAGVRAAIRARADER